MSQYIGAKDRIDKLLVNKYANLQVNNFNSLPEMPTDKFWAFMDMIARYEKAIHVDIKKINEANRKKKSHGA
jgi:hypothetical protein